MATVTWPTKFPKPTINFTGRVNQSTRRTTMDSGRVRQARRFTVEVRVYDAKWTMDNAQFEMFQAWVKYKIMNGAEFFNISLPLGGGSGGMKTVEARFVNGEYNWAHKGVLYWEVSAKLEVEDAGLPLETILNLYLAS